VAERLNALLAKLKPNHAKKRPAGPSDWLTQHHEDGQTFFEYRSAHPRGPDKQHTTLYVVMVGTFTPDQQKLVDLAAEGLGAFYSAPVKRLDPIALEAIPASARRQNPDAPTEQILSTAVLDLLDARKPADALAVIALTTRDLWPGEHWNFVFGQADRDAHVGVWSLARFGSLSENAGAVRRRTLQVALHETGHMLGLDHCIFYECGMDGSNSLPESDLNPIPFCPEDEAKVWWATGADPVARYQKLVAFAQAQGMEELTTAWSQDLAALQK
jgi:archaemetzincin